MPSAFSSDQASKTAVHHPRGTPDLALNIQGASQYRIVCRTSAGSVLELPPGAHGACCTAKRGHRHVTERRSVSKRVHPAGVDELVPRRVLVHPEQQNLFAGAALQPPRAAYDEWQFFDQPQRVSDLTLLSRSQPRRFRCFFRAMPPLSLGTTRSRSCKFN